MCYSYEWACYVGEWEIILWETKLLQQNLRVFPMLWASAHSTVQDQITTICSLRKKVCNKVQNKCFQSRDTTIINTLAKGIRCSQIPQPLHPDLSPISMLQASITSKLPFANHLSTPHLAKSDIFSFEKCSLFDKDALCA